jgi:hypothetical protein
MMWIGFQNADKYLMPMPLNPMGQQGLSPGGMPQGLPQGLPPGAMPPQLPPQGGLSQRLPPEVLQMIVQNMIKSKMAGQGVPPIPMPQQA